MSLTVDHLSERYDQHAATYYRKPSGKPTNTRSNISNATRSLCQCRLQDERAAFRVGTLRADCMSKRILRAVQKALAESQTLSRNEINDRMKWVKMMFRWAADEELVPDSIPPELDRVKGLKKGRTVAPESPGVKAVDWETISETIAHAPLRLATQIEIQYLTAQRPCELVIMQWGRINQDKSPWIYRPDESKSEHLNIEREIPIGPLAQRLLEQWRHRHEGDMLWPMNRMSYSQAVRRIQDRHGLTKWQPRQIRHTAAMLIRQEYGIEAAQSILGHKHVSTTEIYAPRNDRAGFEAVREFG